MSVPADNPDLVKAQYRAFSQQVPLMYFILMASTWALASTHFTLAPAWLTIGVPILMTAVSAARISAWWKSRHVDPTPEIATHALRRTNRLAVVLGVGFAIWSLMLYPYGDAYTQSYLAFYMAITVIGCIFCLTHLRSAAFTVAAIVNGIFVSFFALTGQPTFVAMSVNVVLVSIAMLAILLITYRDFTRMVEAQRRTQALSDENLRLANLDSLTELPNRRAFFARLETAFGRARERRTRLAVGILDLDGFKPVNDLHGHTSGDRLLIEVGRRLTAVCPPNAHLFRLGGDEFALVVSEVADESELLNLGESICAAVRIPFSIPDATVQISGSIGFATYPEMADSSQTLFERADYALYRGKRSKRGHALLFSSDHDAEIHRDGRIEQALQKADLNDELSVVFQPVIDINTLATIGFEALARWESPVLGQVPPSLFIPVAERSGMIGHVTRPLLEKALAAASGWPADIRLSFNLSTHDLSSPESVLSVLGVVKRSGFDPKRLDLEITETAFIHDFGQVREAIGMLKLLGCGISLDDFGTGYSSLSHLHALPLDKIKIDRSFVTGLHRKPASLKIVKSLLALSRDMGLGCVVEGVEAEEEVAVLRNLGGSMVQGFFYSPPIADGEILAFLGAHRMSEASFAEKSLKRNRPSPKTGKSESHHF